MILQKFDNLGFYTSDMRNGIEVQLNLGCNTFKTGGAISNYQSRNGIKLNSGASVADIGGTGTGGSINPAGNVWPEGSNRLIYNPNTRNLETDWRVLKYYFRTPPKWTPIVNNSDTAFHYFKYENEFVINEVNGDSWYLLLLNNQHPYLKNTTKIASINGRTGTNIVKVCSGVAFPPNAFPGREAASNPETVINSTASEIATKSKIYPNPANSILNIDLAGDFSDEFVVSIISASGKEVLRTENSKELKVSFLPIGMYKILIRDIHSKALYSSTFIKE